MRKYLKIFSLIIVASVIIFYNFENRITYGPEQGISLLSSSENLNKPSLLGIPYLLRQTENGLRIFTSPIFGYILLPFVLIFKFNPIGITYVFGFLTLITAFVLYKVVEDLKGGRVALLSSFFYLFNARMIYHSFFIWTSNLMPLIGILTFYLLSLHKKNYSNLNLFILGMVLGLGVGIQYFYTIVTLFVLFYVLYTSKEKIQSTLFLILGGVISMSPTILFDLKHQFYNLKTLSMYFLQILKVKGESQISYYHFLFLYPIAFYLLALLINILFKKSKLFAYLILVFYIFINLTSNLLNFQKPVGMVDGLDTKKMIEAAKTISEDAGENFNVVTLYDFDTRGHTLRYLLQFMYHRTPMGVTDYPTSSEIYALARDDYDFNLNNPWELNVFKPYNIQRMENVDDSFGLYKLTRK